MDDVDYVLDLAGGRHTRGGVGHSFEFVIPSASLRLALSGCSGYVWQARGESKTIQNMFGCCTARNVKSVAIFLPGNDN